MKCKTCGTENVEEAIFCQECGARIDGQLFCYRCGKLSPENSRFCIHCGSNLQAGYLPRTQKLDERKTAISSQEGEVAALHEEGGTQSGPAAATSTSYPVETATSKPRKVGKKVSSVLGLISFISSSLVLLMSFIFSFSIGMVPYLSSGGQSISSGQGFTLYTYFSDVYNAITPGDSAAYGYAVPVFCTLIVVCILAAAIGVFVLGLLAFIRYLRHKEGSITRYAVYSYFVYLGSVIIFSLLSTTSTSSLDLDVTLSFILDPATICGVTIGAIFLVASIVLDAVAKGVEGPVKSYIAKSCFTGGYFVLGLVCLILLGTGLFSASMSSAKSSAGIYVYGQVLAQNAVSYYPLPDEQWYSFVGNYIGSIIFIVLFLALAVAAVVLFSKLMRDGFDQFGYVSLKKMSITGIVLSSGFILFGLLQIIHDYTTATFMISSGYIFDLTTPILLMVFGALLLALSITTFCIRHLFEKDEKAEENLA